MNSNPPHVLFLCTGNSCRSIMAEALLKQLSDDKLRSSSAGSSPTGQVHPIALTCLARNGTPVDDPRSKSWDEFIDQPVDLVITVCDNAAGETCPVFQGKPAKLHWGLPDPAKAKGTPKQIFREFQSVYDQLHTLISALIAGLEKQPVTSSGEWLHQIDFQDLIARSRGT